MQTASPRYRRRPLLLVSVRLDGRENALVAAECVVVAAVVVVVVAVAPRTVKAAESPVVIEPVVVVTVVVVEAVAACCPITCVGRRPRARRRQIPVEC